MIFLISYSNQEIYYSMTLLYWYYIIILIDILTVLNKHINIQILLITIVNIDIQE